MTETAELNVAAPIRSTTARCLVFTFLITAGGIFSGCERRENERFARLMNLGKAHLENRDSKKAIEVLAQAVKLEPRSPEALRNLARAHRLAHQPAEALAALKRAARAEADSVATEYLTALTYARMSRFEEAVPHFARAVQLDPETAVLRYQLAGAYQAIGDIEKACEQFRETVRLDPLHASAHYRLSSAARKMGDAEAFKRHQREFTRLRHLFANANRSAEALEACAYTNAEPAPMETRKASRASTKPVDVRFRDVTDAAFTGIVDRSVVTAALLQVSESGRPTIFVVDTTGGFGLLRMGPNGVFERSAIETVPPLSESFSSCAVGDFHNDVPPGVKYDAKVHAFNDVVLCGPSGVRLLKQIGSSGFQDVTESAGLEGLSANRSRWVDYEHDGDLDLVVAGTSGASLWQNNGNGQFSDVTADVGLGGFGVVTDVAAIDLDANVAVDMILARGGEPTWVLMNQRAGRFRRMPEPAGLWPAARRVLADDLNNDGWPDTVLVSNERAVIRFGRIPKRAQIDLTGLRDTGAVLVDYDNDGLIDVCVFGKHDGSSGETAIRLFRNCGVSNWQDVSKATGFTSIDFPGVTQVIPVDFDGDHDSDLLVTTVQGDLRVVRNDGGHINGQLKIRLTTLKTNPTGIGTHIEMRDRYWRVTRTAGSPLIEIGLAGHKRFDSVQTVWTNGVVDNLVDVAVSSRPLTIVEKNVATGSCPFVYAWDGGTFRFVTDILGNSPIGLSLRRGLLLPADPDEIVRIGRAEQLPPRDGAYTIVVTDEFREVLYLDQAKLIAVDHRPGVEVHATDKLMPPPFPPSELWAVGDLDVIRQAIGDDGLDRTEAVRERDGVFAPPGRLLPPPYRGMCHPLALTLDFGPLDPTRPWVLALTGWLQYGDASTNIAMSQNNELTIIHPKLEVEDSSGTWNSIDVTVGMPAGKTKTILCDLAGRLPSGTRRLRLTTTFETRWDRIAMLQRKPLAGAAVRELPPSSARLAWRGFSELKQRSPGHPTTPDFARVSEFPPWRTTPAGWCTRYGDVTELTLDRDNRLVLINAGDALTLRFDADGLPPVERGQVRTFFLYSVGWDKDGDHNVVTGDRVEPLPNDGVAVDEAAPDDPNDWRVIYNTRLVPFDRFTPPP